MLFPRSNTQTGDDDHLLNLHVVVIGVVHRVVAGGVVVALTTYSDDTAGASSRRIIADVD